MITTLSKIPYHLPILGFHRKPFHPLSLLSSSLLNPNHGTQHSSSYRVVQRTRPNCPSALLSSPARSPVVGQLSWCLVCLLFSFISNNKNSLSAHTVVYLDYNYCSPYIVVSSTKAGK